MRILLDTHILLWYLKGDLRLSKDLLHKMSNATVYVSSASIWEIAIKVKAKKLIVNIEEVIKAIEKSEFTELAINSLHAAATLRLPDLHHDPFDRILIAQAITEPLTIITADKQLKSYSDLVEIVET